MKKLVYIFAVLFLGITSATAQKLVIEDCDVYQGSVTTIPVKYVTEGAKCGGGQLNIELPEGLSFVLVEDEETGEESADAELGAELQGFTLVTSTNGFAVFGTKNLPGDEGTLLKFKIKADASLEIGTKLKCRVYNVAVPTTDGNVKNTEYTFTVTIVENRVTLDEAVGVTSETPTGEQNVLVKRTIKAGNWSTICLPFAMTGDQVKDAFGEVELADFAGYETEKNADGDIVGINVKFNSVDATAGLQANHPCIIKVGETVNEFSVDGVTIEPEDEPTVAAVKRTKKQWSELIGTYVANTVVGNAEEDSWMLYLANNKFYYSKGTAKMKAFRAYFDFYDVLADFENAAKIGFYVDGDATSIDGIGTQRVVEGVYDLSGRKIQLENGDLNKLQKGVYIIDGKKVTIK